jgi:hypothetical protein
MKKNYTKPLCEEDNYEVCDKISISGIATTDSILETMNDANIPEW